MRTVNVLSISLIVLAMIAVFVPAQMNAAALEVTHTQNTGTIPLYEVFEITFQHDQEYDNPFFDVTIEVTFQSPGGRSIVVGGFHYGSAEPPEIHKTEGQGERRRIQYIFQKQDIWKARFAPQELGRWSYKYTFTNDQGMTATGDGSFTCIKGRNQSHGFIRQHLRRICW